MEANLQDDFFKRVPLGRKLVKAKRVILQTRPHFFFEFQDQWTFSRKCEPTIPSIKNFEGQLFNADIDKFTNRPLTALETDFLWMIFAIYMADRFAPRRPLGHNGPMYWRRHIHVKIPVREISKWMQIEGQLMGILEFLTEDDWSFEFVPNRNLWSCESQEHLARNKWNNSTEWVALFSGGLDSLAGALHQLHDISGRCLLVSGQTNRRMKMNQEDLIKNLSESFLARINHCGIYYGLHEKIDLSGIESSQRSRAFVHVGLGSLMALLAENQKLLLFENGIGAINLACDSSQIGSQNSRGTHPIFLFRMGKLIQGLFDKPFSILNPFLFKTKGEMLKSSLLEPFSEVMQKTFSCDRFPNYNHKASQCGHCPSCLIRRQAFNVADLPDAGECYSMDVFNLKRSMRNHEHLALSKLDIQAQTLALKLQASNPWKAISAEWPNLIATDYEVGIPEFQSKVVSLLKQHVDEWRSFKNAIDTRHLKIAA